MENESKERGQDFKNDLWVNKDQKKNGKVFIPHEVLFMNRKTHEKKRIFCHSVFETVKTLSALNAQ